MARDPLLGWRDVAIVRVLGEAGLRCEELIRLERRTSSRLAAALSSARLRSATARVIADGGCDSRRRRRRPCCAGTASAEARTRWTGGPGPEAPLFVTLGRRRRDGTYTRPGRPCTHAVLDDLVKRLGRGAGVPEELRHAHVLRHTFATRFIRATGDVPTLRKILGHQDLKTTMVYVQVDAEHQERQLLRFAGGRLPLEEEP